MRAASSFNLKERRWRSMKMKGQANTRFRLSKILAFLCSQMHQAAVMKISHQEWFWEGSFRRYNALNWRWWIGQWDSKIGHFMGVSHFVTRNFSLCLPHKEKIWTGMLGYLWLPLIHPLPAKSVYVLALFFIPEVGSARTIVIVPVIHVKLSWCKCTGM